jgi:hypothetical protein
MSKYYDGRVVSWADEMDEVDQLGLPQLTNKMSKVTIMKKEAEKPFYLQEEALGVQNWVSDVKKHTMSYKQTYLDAKKVFDAWTAVTMEDCKTGGVWISEEIFKLKTQIEDLETKKKCAKDCHKISEGVLEHRDQLLALADQYEAMIKEKKEKWNKLSADFQELKQLKEFIEHQKQPPKSEKQQPSTRQK